MPESTTTAQNEVENVITTKENILNNMNEPRKVIIQAISDFKNTFNTKITKLSTIFDEKKIVLGSLNDEITQQKNSFKSKFKNLEEKIAFMEDKISDTNNKITNDKTHSEKIQVFLDSDRDCDLEITRLENENDTTKTNIEQLEIESESITKQIVEIKTKMVSSQTDLDAIILKTNNFSQKVSDSDEHIIENLLNTGIQTMKIDRYVHAGNEEYSESITKQNTEAESVIELNPQKAPEEKNSSTRYKGCPFEFKIIDDLGAKPWSKDQTNEYKNELSKYAIKYNGDRRLNDAQKKSFFGNVSSSQKNGEPLVHNSKTLGTWFDVSSSEVDISEFSMDELAAHVENLTAELRAL